MPTPTVLRVFRLEDRVTPVTFGGPYGNDTGGNARAVAAGDFNGDGFNDVVVTTGEGAGVTRFLNDGAGNLVSAAGFTVGGAERVAVADVTGDGKLDVLVGSPIGQYVAILKGNGDGSFQPAVIRPSGSTIQDLVVADLNGDGKLDVAAANGFGAFVYLNDGSAGIFASPVLYSAPSFPDGIGIDAGDFNADGKMDLALAGYNSNSVQILLNAGSGTFTYLGSGIDVGAGNKPFDVDAVDLNGDGKLDLTAAYAGSGLIGVMLGIGNGTFTGPTTYPTGYGAARRLAHADFDRDGKMDVAVNADSGGGARQVVFRGKGDGTLAAGLAVGSAIFPTDVYAADITGDGLEDLLSTSSTSPGGVAVTPNQTRVVAGFTVSAPASAVANRPLTVTVTVRDNTGAVLTGYTGTVRFTSTDPAAGLPADYTFTPADNGVKTFTLGVTLRTPGSRQVRVTDVWVPVVTSAATVTVTANNLPTITDVGNQTNPTGPIGFTVGDVETAAAALTVTAASSNPTLLPAGSVVVGGSGANRTITLTPAAGQYGSATVTLTVTDEDGGTTTDTFLVTFPPPPPPPRPPRVDLFAVAAGPGGGPHVRVYNPDGSERFSYFAYDPGFTGGISVATADVTGDGVDDIITGALSGGGPHVQIFDGTNLRVVRSFFAYDVGFRGGVQVAAGDVTGDGIADVVTSAGSGGGPHVQVFDGATGLIVRTFFAYDVNFRGGVRASAGDVTGDGIADIATAAGGGGGPHVKVFDGNSLAEVRSLFAYDVGFGGGLNVAAGDVTGDGFADLLVGQASQGSQVRVIDAKSLAVVTTIEPFGGFAGGSRVTAADMTGDGAAEVVIGAGPTGGPRFQAWTVGGVKLFDRFAYDPGFTRGIAVG